MRHLPDARSGVRPDRRLHMLLGVVFAAGAAAAGWSLAGMAAGPLPLWWAPVLAAFVGALADLAMVHIRFGPTRYAFTFSEALILIGLVYVPHPWLALLAPMVVAFVHLVSGRPAVKAAFNAAGMAAGIAMAGLVYDLVRGAGPLRVGRSDTWVALVLASVLLFVWNQATVTAAVALSQGLRVRDVVPRSGGLYGLVWVGNTLAGAGLVTLAHYDTRVLAGFPVVFVGVCVLYRFYMRAMRDADTWRLLQDSSRQVAQLSPPAVAAAVLPAAHGLFGAEFVELLMVSESGSAEAYRRLSDGSSEVLRGTPASLSPAFWPRVASEREVYRVAVGAGETPQQAEMAAHGLQAVVVAPLVLSGSCLGMLRLGFLGSVSLARREAQVLTTFANHVASSVANALLFEQTADLFEKNRILTESLGEGVIAVDTAGVVTFANPAAAAMVARSAADMVGRPVHDVLHGGMRLDPVEGVHPTGTPCPLLEAVVTGRTVRSDDHVVIRSDESLVPVAFTASPLHRGETVVGAVLALRDMTERRALEAALTYQAFHDPITDVANRALFLDRLHHAMERRGTDNAVLFVDLDRFKIVNDSLGHRVGDVLLKQVAQRLSSCLRPADTLARFGGDEFTVLLEDVETAADPVTVAGRILAAMARPFKVGGREIVLSVSVGVAMAAAGPHPDPQALVHRADLAMYRAKGRGRDCYAVFVEEMGDRPVDRLDLESSLRRALDNREFRVHYQPVVSAVTGKVAGVEALVRWQSPRGLLTPEEFIGAAEESGLILPLGRMVLEEACRQVRRWQDELAGPEPLVLSVNLSARQFLHEGLASDIARILEHSGLAPEHLCLEITESVIMTDVPSTISSLEQLKDLGVRLAIDDFGTGYSSLSYLKRFPVDVVKIDRSFVGGLGEHPVDTEIVAAVVRLTRSLGMQSVAEGVETGAQLERLRELGCPLVQGWFFAPAQPSERIEALIEQQLATSA
ncbi:MAG TPA: EAL domain-containing protein [Acidimicrobiales bacterium]|nr:EAL domain-containing protein [Acidimicrobiales bacterium]